MGKECASRGGSKSASVYRCAGMAFRTEVNRDAEFIAKPGDWTGKVDSRCDLLFMLKTPVS